MLEIGAHIAAVPLNGHDSRRAECRDYSKKQRLSEMTEWLVACSIHGQIQFCIKGGGLGAIHLPESQLFDVGKGSRDQNKQETHKGESMAILLATLDFLLGCHHVYLSRVFTLQGETYRVCCDCGAKFAYSLETMSIERRLPLTPVLTRLRIA